MKGVKTMCAVVTMRSSKNKIRSFKVNADGTALTSRFVKIKDFAAFFVFLVENGWELISQMNIPTSENNQIEYAVNDEYTVDRKNEFRSQWFQMMSDLVDNYDRG